MRGCVLDSSPKFSASDIYRYLVRANCILQVKPTEHIASADPDAMVPIQKDAGVTGPTGPLYM